MGTDEFQPQPDYSRGVDLVQLLRSEFAAAPSVARMQLAMGDVFLDDVPYRGEDKFLIPYKLAKGKTIKVVGPDRAWQVKFDG